MCHDREAELTRGWRMDGAHGPHAVDLRPLPPEAWDELEVPDGWEPIAALCQRLVPRVPALAERAATVIRERIPAYRAVPRQDLVASSTRILEMTLMGIAERRGPRDDELRIREALGTRRAEQGVRIDRVLLAYQLGHELLWSELFSTAEGAGPATTHGLLEASGTALQWLQRVTSAIAEVHEEHGLGEVEDVVAWRLLTRLVSAGPGAEAVELAETLGLDPDGPFQALRTRGVAHLHRSHIALRERLGEIAAPYASAVLEGELLALVQPPGGREIPGDVLSAERPVGVGLVRPRLEGAVESLRDADLAATAATREGGIVRFGDRWGELVLTEAAARTGPLLDRAMGVAHARPELAETIVAFAGSGLSTSAVAQQLDVHPNTVNYRLGRWEELTGCDPRTFEGLARSLAAARHTGAAGRER